MPKEVKAYQCSHPGCSKVFKDIDDARFHERFLSTRLPAFKVGEKIGTWVFATAAGPTLGVVTKIASSVIPHDCYKVAIYEISADVDSSPFLVQENELFDCETMKHREPVYFEPVDCEASGSTTD